AVLVRRVERRPRRRPARGGVAAKVTTRSANEPMRRTVMPNDSKTMENQGQQPNGEDVLVRLKERIAPVDQWVRTLVRERPLLALAGALGIGYLVGRLVRRI